MVGAPPVPDSRGGPPKPLLLPHVLPSVQHCPFLTALPSFEGGQRLPCLAYVSSSPTSARPSLSPLLSMKCAKKAPAGVMAA